MSLDILSKLAIIVNGELLLAITNMITSNPRLSFITAAELSSILVYELKKRIHPFWRTGDRNLHDILTEAVMTYGTSCWVSDLLDRGRSCVRDMLVEACELMLAEDKRLERLIEDALVDLYDLNWGIRRTADWPARTG